MLLELNRANRNDRHAPRLLTTPIESGLTGYMERVEACSSSGLPCAFLGDLQFESGAPRIPNTCCRNDRHLDGRRG